MLADETVQNIQRLLKSTTLSQRAIARKVGVNRETVNLIANDARFDVAAYKRTKAALEPEIVEPIRCHGCGTRINVIPCQLCKLRKMIRQKTLVRRFAHMGDQVAGAMGIDLMSPHLERYLAIRARKIRRGEKPASNLSLLTKALVTGNRAVPTFANVRYIRWFLVNVEELGGLLDLPERLARSSTATEKWALLKQAGDLVLLVVGAHPIRPVHTGTTHELRLELESHGVPWDKFLVLLPTLVDLIDFVQGNRLEEV